MKKLLFLCATFCVLFSAQAQAQEFPYSKYLNFSKADFESSKFKYNKKFNVWTLSRIDGWNEAANILCFLLDASEDVRPSIDDYTITAHMGDEDMVSYLVVEFYDDDIYHKILTFMKNDAQNTLETVSGKLVRHQALYDNYDLELNMEQHIISRTSERTLDYKTVKNVDESYNEYTFVIRTDIPATSKYLDKQAKKKAKREAKGKALDLEDMM